MYIPYVSHLATSSLVRKGLINSIQTTAPRKLPIRAPRSRIIMSKQPSSGPAMREFISPLKSGASQFKAAQTPPAPPVAKVAARQSSAMMSRSAALLSGSIVSTIAQRSFRFAMATWATEVLKSALNTHLCLCEADKPQQRLRELIGDDEEAFVIKSHQALPVAGVFGIHQP